MIYRTLSCLIRKKFLTRNQTRLTPFSENRFQYRQENVAEKKRANCEIFIYSSEKSCRVRPALAQANPSLYSL